MSLFLHGSQRSRYTITSSFDRMSIGLMKSPSSPFNAVGDKTYSIAYTSDLMRFIEEGSICSTLRFGDIIWHIGSVIGVGYYTRERIMFFTHDGELIGPRFFFRIDHGMNGLIWPVISSCVASQIQAIVRYILED